MLDDDKQCGYKENFWYRPTDLLRSVADGSVGSGILRHEACGPAS